MSMLLQPSLLSIAREKSEISASLLASVENMNSFLNKEIRDPNELAGHADKMEAFFQELDDSIEAVSSFVAKISNGIVTIEKEIREIRRLWLAVLGLGAAIILNPFIDVFIQSAFFDQIILNLGKLTNSVFN